MSIPTIAAVRKSLVAPPGKAFDLSARETSGRAIFSDKEAAETSLKKDAAEPRTPSSGPRSLWAGF